MTESSPVGIENSFTKRLEQRGVFVRRGFDSTIANALYEGAKDPVVRQFTHDATRFSTPDSVETWAEDPEKRPVIYSLADQAILGVIWFSHTESEHASAHDSFAIRMYEGGRGRGLASDFLEAAHVDFHAQGGESTWLRVRRENTTAQQLYSRHGYQITHQTKTFQTMQRKGAL